MEGESDQPLWVGPYLLERVLGRSARSTVHLARSSVGVDRYVAVKLLDDPADRTGRQQLLDEARTLSQLDHPHITRLLDVVDTDDTLAIIMQHASNGTLADRLAGGPLGADEVIGLVAPLAAALASAHRNGIVHGDVKPSNVLLTADDHAVLSDFGAARSASDVVTPDVIWGSAGYLDPEVHDGAPPSPSSDLYALGVLAYESLTGHLPFDGSSVTAVLRAADIGDHEPLDADELGPLADVVEQAMARRRRHRFADLTAFERALISARATLAGGPSDATGVPSDDVRATTTFQRPGRPAALAEAQPGVARNTAKQLKLATAAAAAAVLLIGGGVAFAGRGSSTKVEGGQVSARAFCDPATTSRCITAVDRTASGLSVTFAGNTTPTEFRVGEPADALRVANWFCGQVETLALYRPATGVVYYFQRWPEPGETVDVVADATGITNAAGITVSDSDGDGCADLGIERDGTRTWFLPVSQTQRLQRVAMPIAPA